MTPQFSPDHITATAMMDGFLQNPIRRYEALRNYDFGVERRGNVSCLSPYISHRVLSEYEVVAQTLSKHALADVEKYVQEVFWRVYWKGWLEHRPSVWDQFTSFDLNAVPERVLHNAITGNTGIDCFDAWAKELVTTNYLHNHARMWFASIWIFTLGLPWQLGARFFMEHLLDGDAASNTLGWRWVAGIQTKGKHYVARPDNIAKYTDYRFETPALNEGALPIDDMMEHPLGPIAGDAGRQSNHLLVCDTDLYLRTPDDYAEYAQVYVLHLETGDRALALSDNVMRFKSALVDDFCTRCPGARRVTGDDVRSLMNDMATLDVIYPFIGDNLDFLTKAAAKAGINLNMRKRQQDLHCWQFAKKGFFNFKKNIPSIIETLELQPFR